jgi:YidC/Oxa1 family membrane protein insertase
MDSKALLAIVLSFLIFLLWHFYFAPEQTPQQKRTPGATTTTQPQTAPQPAPAPVSPAPPPPAAVSPPPPAVDLSSQKTWSISDSVFKMKIIAQGARESSFELLRFKQEQTPDSPPVQMVRDSRYLPLDVELLLHKNWELYRQTFSSDAPTEFQVASGEPPGGVPFETEIPGKVRLTKIFTVIPDSYVVDLEIRIQNLSPEKLTDQMGLSLYFRPYSEASNETYNLSRLTFNNGSNHDLSAKDFTKPDSLPKPPYDWVGYQNNFFIQAIIPLEQGGYQIIPSTVNDEAQHAQITRLFYLTEQFELNQNESKSFKLRLYSGPKDIAALTQAGRNLTAAVDYGWFSFLAKPLLVVLRWFYSFTHNYGVAIILMTVIIKIIFWPLTQKSYTSMQKMKKIQPKIQQIREKFKDDREKLNQELMQVYKTYKVNPMGGCLPMALQIPVFFALYRMLNSAVELRHQPFILWIHDLTAPDRLNLGFSIDLPIIGHLSGLPVLTILMGITMFLQQKMTPSSGDPRQEKIMLIMPVMFTFFFINFPAGLVLYWFVNNILSIAQQYWINRHAGA